jgi:hypothetical protein
MSEDKGLKRSISLGELISSIVGVITLVSIWAINLDSKVKENGLRIRYLEQNFDSAKEDLKEIKRTTNEILINLEKKKDRD